MKNIINKMLMVLFIGLLAITQTLAQEVLTLQDCKLKALDHNQTLKSAISDLKSNEVALKLSKRALLPNFDFESSYTYLSKPNQMHIPSFELPNADGSASGVYFPETFSNIAYEHSYAASLEMSLPIYMGGKLQYAKQLSSLSLKMANDNVELTKSDLLLEIEKKYWGLVSLKEQKTVVEKSVVLLTDVVKEITNWYKTGIVTKNEVLKSQVELNNAKLSLIELSNNVELAKMSLNQSIGNSIMSPVQIQDSILIISGELSSISFDENHLNNRPEIKMLNNQLEMANTQKKIVNADYMPELISFANYVSQNPNHISDPENEFSFNGGLSLNIPVFHWGERNLKKQQQQMSIQKSEYELDQSTEYITLEIRQAIFRLRESLIKLDFTQTSLEQADENLKLETNRLKEGVTTTRDLLDAQLQWQSAHANYINAKTEVKTNEATYYKSIGELQ